MTNRRVGLLLLGLLLCGRAQAQDLRWETDLAQARAQAAEQGRPLLVVFR